MRFSASSKSSLAIVWKWVRERKAPRLSTAYIVWISDLWNTVHHKRYELLSHFLKQPQYRWPNSRVWSLSHFVDYGLTWTEQPGVHLDLSTLANLSDRAIPIYDPINIFSNKADYQGEVRTFTRSSMDFVATPVLTSLGTLITALSTPHESYS